MNGLLSVYKERSDTPLETINRLREELGVDDGIKIGYAGRLDPLASGVLLLMIGDQCKLRDRYQDYNKEYQFNILFGISTDSLDPMGMIENFSEEKINIDRNNLLNITEEVSEMTQQKYPLYSSYIIDGYPMFKLAKEGKIDDRDRPLKNIEIKSIRLVDLQSVNRKSLVDKFMDQIRNVNGSFRQREIIDRWEQVSDKVPDKLLSAKFICEVESGTYVRVIGEDICNKLGIDGLVYNIERSRLGKFNIDQAIHL